MCVTMTSDGRRCRRAGAGIAATDPATCDSTGLTLLAAGVHRVRCWLDWVDASAVARSAELASAGGRRSSREAEVLTERATVCAAMPEVHAAWRPGRCRRVMPTRSLVPRTARRRRTGRAGSAGAEPGRAGGDDVGRRVRPQDPRPRPSAVTRRGLRHHERPNAQRAVSRWTDREGMCHTHISLDPEADAPSPPPSTPRSPREGQARRRPDVRPAEGRRLPEHGHRPGSTWGAAPGRDQRLIDLATLQRGLHETSVCETFDAQPLPPATVRRLACDAEIIPIVLGGDGKVVDLGRPDASNRFGFGRTSSVAPSRAARTASGRLA